MNIHKGELNAKNRTLFIQDNLAVLDMLNDNCIDLIYLDPPFNSNRNYAAPVGSKAAGSEFKDMWHLEDVDKEWIGMIKQLNKPLGTFLDSVSGFGGKGDTSYLIYMSRRLIEMQRILKKSGSIYLHCDPTMSHSLKIVMDCIFGKKNFRNEIIWHYGAGHPPKKDFARKHDIILRYTKSNQYFFDSTAPCMRIPFNQTAVDMHFNNTDKSGRSYRQYASGKKSYLDDGKAITDVWVDIDGQKARSPLSAEYTGFKTQKPLALLERIINASSNKGDIVFDPFCGCATALVAAEKLERQWIGCDLSDKAVDLIRQRLQAEELLWTQVKQGKNLIVRKDLLMRTDVEKDKIYYKKHKPELYTNQSGKCNGCEKHFDAYNMAVDHIFPKSKGGTDNIKNLQLLCNGCNSIKGVKDMLHLRVELKKLGIIK